MPLPWVSRERYEEARAMLASKELENARLHEKYEALVLSFFAPKPPVTGQQTSTVEPPNAVPKKKSPIREAIQQESQGDAKLARYLMGRYRELRSEGMSPADAMEEIRKWETSEQYERQSA